MKVSLQVWQLSTIMFSSVIVYNLIDGDFMGALVLSLGMAIIVPFWYLIEMRMAESRRKRELRIKDGVEG